MKETVSIVGSMVGYVDEISSMKSTKAQKKKKKKSPLLKMVPKIRKESKVEPKQHASSTEEVFPLGEDDLKEF